MVSAVMRMTVHGCIAAGMCRDVQGRAVMLYSPVVFSGKQGHICLSLLVCKCVLNISRDNLRVCELTQSFKRPLRTFFIHCYICKSQITLGNSTFRKM